MPVTPSLARTAHPAGSWRRERASSGQRRALASRGDLTARDGRAHSAAGGAALEAGRAVGVRGAGGTAASIAGDAGRGGHRVGASQMRVARAAVSLAVAATDDHLQASDASGIGRADAGLVPRAAAPISEAAPFTGAADAALQSAASRSPLTSAASGAPAAGPAGSRAAATSTAGRALSSGACFRSTRSPRSRMASAGRPACSRMSSAARPARSARLATHAAAR